MSDDDVHHDRHLKTAGFMKQPFKIYENLRSAVSVYRGHGGSSSRSGVYQVPTAIPAVLVTISGIRT